MLLDVPLNELRQDHSHARILLERVLVSVLLVASAGCSGSSAPSAHSGGASGQSGQSATGGAVNATGGSAPSGGSSSGGTSSGGTSSGGAGTTGGAGGGHAGSSGAGGAECTIVTGDFRTCVQQLRTKLDAAKECTAGARNQCQARIVDDCGCQQAVNDVNSSAVLCYIRTESLNRCKSCDPTCAPVVGQCQSEDAGVARCR